MVLSRHGLACKYGILLKYQYTVGCTIVFSDTCQNYQSGKVKTENWFDLLFK